MTFALATVALSGTSVAPTAQPPDNCAQIRVRNPSSTVTVLIGFGPAGGALTEGVDAFGIAPGATEYVPIDVITRRGAITTMIVDSVGGAVVPKFTYFNVAGPL